MQRLRLNLDFKAVILLLTIGVLLPVMLSTIAGIVAIIFADDAGGIVTGVLVISFTAAAAGSALVAVVLMARKAKLARLQSDFIANVSHELRTPLTNIRLHTQTLQSGAIANDPKTAADCLSTILRETEWLESMVAKVLTWRASAGNILPLHRVTQPVSQAVSQAVDRFQGMVRAGPIDFSVSSDSRLAVRHDVEAIASVLLNLLTNAYKSTGSDKRIRLTTQDTTDGIVITVSDNGVGLSSKDTENIFEPFYRVAQQHGGDRGGMGLGLTIARHIITRHGGSITASGTPGEGAVFTVRLPTTRKQA